MHDHPLISVLTPVYNGSEYLAECIQSILAQTLTDFELLIVDDGSTDASLEIARDFAARDARIRVIPLPHGGRSQARNAGIAAARGEYIAWQDADDISLPNRLDAQLAYLRARNLDICGSCARFFGWIDSFIWFPEQHASIQYELLFRAGLLQSTVLIRTEVARANLYDEAVSFEDYEMWARLAPHYRMGNVPQVLFMYRIYGNQSHLLESIESQADLLAFSKRLFVSLFPQSSPEDRSAVAGLVARQPAGSLEELRRMGAWLARFSLPADILIQRQMQNRWRSICLRSAPLGVGVLSIYRQMFPAARLPFPADLALLCLLRVRPDSRLFLALRSAVGRVQGLLRKVKLRGH